MAVSLGRILCFGLLVVPPASALREAIGATDLDVDSSTCSGLRCLRAADSGRLNQGRFHFQAADAQRVSWRLVAEAAYSLQRDSQCAGEGQSVVASASVVPWINGDDPINSSTIEVYVPAIVDLNLRLQGPQEIFLCASKSFRQEHTCLCQLDLAKGPNPGLLPRLGQLLPGRTQAVAAEVQVTLDRACPAHCVPDALVASILALLLMFLLVCIEAALAWPRTGDSQGIGKAASEAGLVISGPLAPVQTGAAGAVGFVTLMATTQGIAVAKAVESQLPEAVVWSLVAAAAPLSVVSVWRSFQSVCQIQLCEAYLQNGFCVRNAPSVAHMDYALAAGILLYTLTILAGILLVGAVSATDRAGLLMLLITALVGPVVNLLLRVKAGTDSEAAAAQVKLQPTGLEAMMRRNLTTENPGAEGSGISWTFMQWAEVLAAGRQGRDVRAASGAGEQHPQHKEEDGQSFSLLSDVRWQRQCVYKLTGSRAGFLVWPGCFISLALALGSTAMQGMLFMCSRGELSSLEVTGLSSSLHFTPGQDHYVLGADQSVRQVSLLASAHEVRTTRLTVEPPFQQSRSSALAPVPVGSMTVPRLAHVTVQGQYPGLAATEYFVRFAPQAKLAQALVIEEASLGFRRCISWGTLPGSQLSVPPQVKSLNATILFADFVLSVPLAKDQAEHLEVAADATWTVFQPADSSSSCASSCWDDPDCLEAFDGRHGCFGAHHSHAWHESQKCSGAAKVDEEVKDRFRAQMFGCVTNASAFGAECGRGLLVQNQTVRFTSVLPDWQGGLYAKLRLQLKREQGLERQPSESQAITLYRDLPLPMDVLVRVTARTPANTTEILRSRGRISKTGDIIVTVRKFDPFKFNMLRLIVAPILPDPAFKVVWLSIPNDGSPMQDGDLPVFKRCNKSSFLRKRFRACGASKSARTTEPMNFTFMPWVKPVEGRFVVEPRDPSERSSGFWPRQQPRRLQVQFDHADTPAAWAAEEHGCQLLHEVKRAGLNLVGRSADAFCAMVRQSLTGKRKCDYDELCDAWRTALAEHSRLPASQATQLIACQAMARHLPWPLRENGTCREVDFSDWKFDDNRHTIVKQIHMPTYTRNLDIKLSDFFESLTFLSDRRAVYGIAAAEALCDVQNWTLWSTTADELARQRVKRSVAAMAKAFKLPQYRDEKGLRPLWAEEGRQWYYWISRALRTGSVDLGRAIHRCLRKAHEAARSDLQGAVDKMCGPLAAEAWAAVAKRAGQDDFDQLEYLTWVGNLSTNMPQALVTGALQRGSMPNFRPNLGHLLPGWTSCSEISPSLPRRKELQDLAWVLQRRPCDEVKSLKISGGQFEDSTFPHEEGFFQSLSGLASLASLSIRHFSLSEADMASLSAALRMRSKNGTGELELLELTPRLGERAFPSSSLKHLFGLCIHQLETGDLDLKTSADVNALSSEIAGTQWPCVDRLRIDVTGLSNQTLLREMQPMLQKALRKASSNSSAEFVLNED